MQKLSASELEEIANQYTKSDPSLMALIIALATCRYVEEHVGSDTPEKVLLAGAARNSQNIDAALDKTIKEIKSK